MNSSPEGLYQPFSEKILSVSRDFFKRSGALWECCAAASEVDQLHFRWQEGVYCAAYIKVVG
jgi:hypothetical protein